MRWWWLSFCDDSLPKGFQFLGVAIVQGEGMLEAVIAAHSLGCNPGGEVLSGMIEDHLLPDEQYRNRLLTKLEADKQVEIIHQKQKKRLH